MSQSLSGNGQPLPSENKRGPARVWAAVLIGLSVLAFLADLFGVFGPIIGVLTADPNMAVSNQTPIQMTHDLNKRSYEIVKPLSDEIAGDLKAALHPFRLELEAKVKSGELSEAQKKRVWSERVATFLEAAPQTEAKVRRMIEQVDEDLVCRERGCDKETFDLHYAVSACQIDRTFHVWIERQQQSLLKPVYRNLRAYVQRIDCEKQLA